MSGEDIELELAGARVLFTTAHGSGSIADHRNREQLQERLGLRLAYGKQVHGARVRRVDEGADVCRIEEADGQATALRGIAPTVLSADCLPVALAGSNGVAMLHAGWRGLAAGVLGEGVRALRELGVKDELEAVIGPGAGPCCYEVGEEVHAIFGSDGGNLDMKSIARVRLSEAGVGKVHDVGLCTICSEPAQFYSHRRDHGVTGRQAGVAWLS